MSNSVPVAELLRMTPDELRREIAMHRIEYAKMRMGIEMQKEKNHALFKTKRREIARMETVMTQMKREKVQTGQRGQKVQTSDKKTSVTSVTSVPSKKPSQAKRKSVKSTGSKSTKS